MKRFRIAVIVFIFLAGIGLGSISLLGRLSQEQLRSAEGMKRFVNGQPPRTPNPTYLNVNWTPANGAGTNAVQVASSSTNYQDGTYTGQRAYAFYGYVQVRATVQNGRLQNVRVLEHPNHNGTSRYINSVAIPYLVQEAINVQDARVNLISGATLTSRAFVQSLDTALQKAGA